MEKTKRHLISYLSPILCILLSGLPMVQGEERSDNYVIEKLVIGTTNQVEDININDNTFTTYLETLLTKSLIRVDQSGNFVPALAESWETDDAEVWTFHLAKYAPMNMPPWDLRLARGMNIAKSSPGLNSTGGHLVFRDPGYGIKDVGCQEIGPVIMEGHESHPRHYLFRDLCPGLRLPPAGFHCHHFALSDLEI